MPKILIVDDEEFNRDILRTRLEGSGFVVLDLAGGEEVVQTAKSARPDLILLDVMMPRINGWKVCELLKADPQTAGVPVVMLTACVQQIDELRSWESGASGYITKPWDTAQLLETINGLLPLRAKSLA